MTDNNLNSGLAKNFRRNITKVEQDIRAIADGVNVLAGTEDKPILTDAKEVPIRNFFMAL